MSDTNKKPVMLDKIGFYLGVLWIIAVDIIFLLCFSSMAEYTGLSVYGFNALMVMAVPAFLGGIISSVALDHDIINRYSVFGLIINMSGFAYVVFGSLVLKG